MDPPQKDTRKLDVTGDRDQRFLIHRYIMDH